MDEAVLRISRSRRRLGALALAIGLTLQAGATSAVKAVKMSAKLISGHQPEPGG